MLFYLLFPLALEDIEVEQLFFIEVFYFFKNGVLLDDLCGAVDVS